MHTNRLINESSPYLLQHAHNPVDWFPWGNEALTKAKEQNKPILVSIGYAACHWCHVMEKESFEDEVTALLMNEHFINIKIDREERPDLDHIYMDAVQAITGSGGWPLNVFLTPDCKPFYGGTYFPPIKAYNRMSWKEVLQNIAKAYLERREEIETQAQTLTNHLAKSNLFERTNTCENNILFTQKNLELIAQNILKQADTEWGGFGNAPKFPQTFSIQFLLRHYHFTKDETALNQALLSLDKMIGGGIYDQIGGGFSRYSTDAKWLAPHFEKMLYDNALLIGVLSEAYQLTQNEAYKETICHTLSFIERELMHENGGFFSALDADSEGIEGKFYTWSEEEIDIILGAEARIYKVFYGVTKEGNWEHTNILWKPQSISTFALENGYDESELKKQLWSCNNELLQVRNSRIRPALDDKIILGWNALMITAYCKAYAATLNEHFMNVATSSMQFLQSNFQNIQEASWSHTYKNNTAKIPAFLDDYAYLIQAMIGLQEITGNQEYLIKAKEITQHVVNNFSENEIFFYYTHQQQTDIIVRKKEVYDGATPSGNGIMALNLQYLGIVFNETNWIERADKMVITLSNATIKYPTSFGIWSSFLQQKAYGIKEIVLTGEKITKMLPIVLNKYVPNKVIQASTKKNNLPLIDNKFVEGKNTFYLCKNYSCSQPLTDLEAFLAIM
jgi:uncharacterized protein YyaL (SSP411 family)